MYVVTFYSFKGGVGRTLALLNVAYEIADSGPRVLVVDFDLEAPAIRPDRWKQGANDDETDQVGRGPTDPGVVEFVTRYLETMQVPPVTDYIVDANPEGCRGHLAVMSAGAVDATYGRRLNAIDWGLLYAARDGYVMFEDVRAQWQTAGFDYVLLDSRTGFTDVGGICTRHLPDAVVSLFRPDDQSLGGTAQMAEAIRAEAPTPRRADDIEQHFVMAGIPDADDEHGHLARRRKVFVDRLGIPGADRLTEIRHYSSMDLLTQPIYTMERRGTRLAKSYMALTQRIRARNVGDRAGVLDGLRDRHLPVGGRHTDYLSHTGYLNRVGKHYSDDSEVLAEVAEAYGREGDLLAAASMLDKASRVGRLTLRDFLNLARGRQLIGDQEGALQALRSFFDGSAEPSAETPRALVVEGLDLLQLLGGEDVGGIVADSPVIAGAPPSTRAAVAVGLDRSVSQYRSAIAILEELITADDAAPERDDWSSLLTFARERDDWNWHLAFARMAVGEFERAAAFFEDAMANSSRRVPTAFNAAMADWATRGVPSQDSFSKVLERIDADAHKTWMRGDANALQSVALASWFSGRADDAGKRLAEAEETAGRHEMSCWSYMRVPSKTFLEHCAEIRRLFDGDEVIPVFMRTCEPSGEPAK
ncbi:MAG: AAA family ATPase [Gemmatimonadetes bacterium]|nr:AAA family ATPase [Gemmatimonadota bacterium]